MRTMPETRLIQSMTDGRNRAADLETSVVRIAHHSIDPAKTPAANVNDRETEAIDATEAKMPAKNRIVGGLVMVRPYAVRNVRPPEPAELARLSAPGAASRMHTP